MPAVKIAGPIGTRRRSSTIIISSAEIKITKIFII